MKESKLISYLSSFSKEEMKRFEKFVNSPYFNSERNFKPLLKFLKENHPHFDNSLITIEFIFHKLHPCIPYDKRSSLTTRVMISQLTSLAEKFIAIEGCQKNEGFMSSSLLRELLQKGQAKQFKILRRKLDIEITKSELDYDNLVKKLLVEREINCWTNCGNNKEEVQRIERLLKFEDTIITIFVAMISDLIQWLSKDYYKNGERSELSKKFFENFNFDKFIDSLSDLKNENSSMLQYVYYSIRMEKDTNDFQAYEKLKNIYFRNHDGMSLAMKNTILNRLMNYCSFQFKDKRDYYDNDYLTLYYMQVDLNKSSNDLEVFGIRQLRNYIRKCIRLKRYDELLGFIEVNKDKFHPSIRDNFIFYAEASVQFDIRNFQETIHLLSMINFHVPMIIKDIKLMKIRCFYEMNYYDSVIAEADSYRHYLASTLLIPKEFIDTDLKFLRHLLKLVKLAENPNEHELNKLKKMVGNHTLNDNMKWLIDKIGCLKDN